MVKPETVAEMTSPPSEQVPSADRREEVRELWLKTGAWAPGSDFPREDSAAGLWRFIDSLDAQSAERTRAEVEGLTATLEDEQAAHQDTLRLLANSRAEVEKMREMCSSLAGICASACADEDKRVAAAFRSLADQIAALPIEGTSR